MPVKTREPWMDVARGIGIILVVYGHVIAGLEVSPELWSYTAKQTFLIDSHDIIYTFHMPLFFFLAGVNVEHSLRRGAAAFLKSKWWTVGYPYVVWATLQVTVMSLMASYTNYHRSWGQLLDLPWKPPYQFWFLYCLMVCHVLILPLAGFRRLLLPLAVVMYAVSFYPPANVFEQVTVYFIYYVLGFMLGVWVMAWKPGRITIACGLPLIWVLFALAILGTRQTSPELASGARLMAALTGTAGVVLLSKAFTWTWDRVLQPLGQLSLSIFVMHVLFMAGARIVLIKVGFREQVWLHVAVGTAAGLLVPVLVHAILARFGWLGIVGLGPHARRQGSPGLPSPG